MNKVTTAFKIEHGMQIGSLAYHETMALSHACKSEESPHPTYISALPFSSVLLDMYMSLGRYLISTAQVPSRLEYLKVN
jgi:hypothetical protein